MLAYECDIIATKRHDENIPLWALCQIVIRLFLNNNLRLFLSTPIRHIGYAFVDAYHRARSI